jgi:hypothetical protein
VVDICRFLTQEVIQKNKIEKLIEHEVHGASFTTLKGNKISNAMLTNVYTPRSDAFFRFVVIVGKADCLPTSVNLWRRFNDGRGENCKRCSGERKSTLAHILNECTPNHPLMVRKHNRLANVVRIAVERLLEKCFRSVIEENEETDQ